MGHDGLFLITGRPLDIHQDLTQIPLAPPPSPTPSPLRLKKLIKHSELSRSYNTNVTYYFNKSHLYLQRMLKIRMIRRTFTLSSRPLEALMYLQCLEGCALCYEFATPLMSRNANVNRLNHVRIYAERRFPFFIVLNFLLCLCT